MPLPSRLVKSRHGIYYLRTVEGRHETRKSLGTRDPVAAKRSAYDLRFSMAYQRWILTSIPYVVTYIYKGLKETEMTITTLSSREFNQHASEAKKAASHGPVFITDRGRPAHVLLSIKEYQRLTGGHQKIADLLAMPGAADVELVIPVLSDIAQSADLS